MKTMVVRAYAIKLVSGSGKRKRVARPMIMIAGTRNWDFILLLNKLDVRLYKSFCLCPCKNVYIIRILDLGMKLYEKVMRFFGFGSPVEYQSIGTSRFRSFFQHSFPKEMIPSNRTGTFLGGIFILVIIAALLNFPLNSFLKGDLSIPIEVGVPWSFLVFDLLNPTASPLKIKEFTWSILLYLFIAYLIEVAINYMLTMDIFKSKKEKAQIPVFFKDVKENMAGKLTKEIFGGPKAVKKNEAWKDGTAPGSKTDASKTPSAVTSNKASPAVSAGTVGNVPPSSAKPAALLTQKTQAPVQKVLAVPPRSQVVAQKTVQVQSAKMVGVAQGKPAVAQTPVKYSVVSQRPPVVPILPTVVRPATRTPVDQSSMAARLNAQAKSVASVQRSAIVKVAPQVRSQVQQPVKSNSSPTKKKKVEYIN